MNNYIFPFLWMRDQSEDILREEINKIDECGIKAICLESRPHPDFLGERWWNDFDIVMEEAKKRDMKIWILDDAHFPTGQANGMIPAKHQELARKYMVMQHVDCVGPIVHASLDVGLLQTKAFTWLDFGKPLNKPLLDDKQLVSVMSYPIVEDDILGNEGIDITDCVAENGWLTWDVPEGVWRICVSFITYDFGARNEYINYIDKNSVRVLIDTIYETHYHRYRDDFGNTIIGFFSDEPGYYNVDDFGMNNAIGRKKMALPWSDEMTAAMNDHGALHWKQLLPLLWMKSQDECISSGIRRCYMDQVSRLYSENFSKQIGTWCEDHNVQYIGHVIEDNNEHSRLGCGTGHYFRAMAGQHMAGIDTIGNQILPGNPYGNRHGVAHIINGQFNHFGLAKLGASAAQLDPAKEGKLMCEAFGAYGWNFGVRNIKWLVDYLLVQGVNHFVPHAFSMADYPDDDCPPHFYARGNNPEFSFFVETMKYTNRMCDKLNGGKNVPVLALLYPAEHDWMSSCMEVQVPGRVLQENQLDYEIVPVDALVDESIYGTSIEDGALVINKRIMKKLIIPETRFVDGKLAEYIVKASKQGLDIIFLNQLPEAIVGCDGVKLTALEAATSVISLQELAEYIRREGVFDICLSEKNKDLLYYHYQTEEDMYLLFNTSLSGTVKGTLTIGGVEDYVEYNGWEDKYYNLFQTKKDNGSDIEICLRPYESMLITTNRCHHEVVNQAGVDASNTVDISADWDLSFAKAIDYPRMSEKKHLKKLIPVSDMDFEFAGIMRYEKTIHIDTLPKKAVLKAEHVYEVARMFVNNELAGSRVTPPYEWDITRFLKEGDNFIEIEVANTPTRDTLSRAGIFGPPREIIEPAGIFGQIVLQLYKL